ncbi:hypothetical protein [Nocardia amamiensis]|uniref:hypothetical protein n=1 Tax=Nocardia amamiensis TaxID=404578 RepID=UPI000B06DCE0|nr:hypothetical protein [Nocardia amamiensis]
MSHDRNRIGVVTNASAGDPGMLSGHLREARVNTVVDRDLCLAKHRDYAADDPQFQSITEARLILVIHSGHGPLFLPVSRGRGLQRRPTGARRPGRLVAQVCTRAQGTQPNHDERQRQ